MSWEPALQASAAMSRERSRHPSEALAGKANANVRRQGMGTPDPGSHAQDSREIALIDQSASRSLVDERIEAA